MTGALNQPDPLRLDGNAAGGVLSEVFTSDITTARATCAGCGKTGVFGALVVYDQGMGTIIRCPSCDGVILRVVRTTTEVYLDATGARVLVMERGRTT